MDYWGGQRVCWPLSQIIGRHGRPGHPLPTNMIYFEISLFETHGIETDILMVTNGYK